MEIFGETIDRELHDLAQEGVHTRFLGRRDRAPDWLRRRWPSSSGDRSTSARLAPLDRVRLRRPRRDRRRRAPARGESGAELDEETFAAAFLYAPEMPDPDLVIRTSGERRVSNFLLWQSAYAEYVFTDTLWPDFGPDELRAAIEEYASRRRRFGGR